MCKKKKPLLFELIGFLKDSNLTTSSVLRFLIYNLLRTPKNHQVHFWNALQTATILLSGRLTTFFAYIYENLQLLENRGLVGSPVFESYQKSIRSKSTLASNFTVEMKISDLGASFEVRRLNFKKNNTFWVGSNAQVGNVHFDCEIRRKRWRWAYAFFWYNSNTGIPPTLDFQEVEEFHIYAKNVLRRPLSNL